LAGRGHAVGHYARFNDAGLIAAYPANGYVAP
jgi:hypothetical protein